MDSKGHSFVIAQVCQSQTIPLYLHHAYHTSRALPCPPPSKHLQTIKVQIDCKLYPVLVTQHSSSNMFLMHWFVPSLDRTHPRQTTMLLRQPGSINWIPNDWYFVWFPSVTPSWVARAKGEPRLSCTLSLIISRRRIKIEYSVLMYCISL